MPLSGVMPLLRNEMETLLARYLKNYLGLRSRLPDELLNKFRQNLSYGSLKFLVMYYIKTLLARYLENYLHWGLDLLIGDEV